MNIAGNVISLLFKLLPRFFIVFFPSDWVKVAQSCPAVCDSMDYTVHGILQARILEWPFPSPGDLPNPEIKPRFLALQADCLPIKPQGKPIPSKEQVFFFLISWLQSPSTVIFEPKKIKSVTVSTFSPFICREVMGLDAMILVFWLLSFKPSFSLS